MGKIPEKFSAFLQEFSTFSPVLEEFSSLLHWTAMS